MLCILFEYSNAPCTIQPWMFDVHVISVSLSQKPTVSPYQRGTSAPRRGTLPSVLKLWPILIVVMKLRATPARICTTSGVTITFQSHVAASCQRRMKPSGQQYCDGHCAWLSTPSWYACCTIRCWYSGVSSDKIVVIWL